MRRGSHRKSSLSGSNITTCKALRPIAFDGGTASTPTTEQSPTHASSLSPCFYGIARMVDRWSVNRVCWLPVVPWLAICRLPSPGRLRWEGVTAVQGGLALKALHGCVRGRSGRRPVAENQSEWFGRHASPMKLKEVSSCSGRSPNQTRDGMRKGKALKQWQQSLYWTTRYRSFHAEEYRILSLRIPFVGKPQ